MKPQLTVAFVCLRCRKVFKRPSQHLASDHGETRDYEPRCPQCNESLIRVGDTFRAPRRTDETAWQRIQHDILKGRTYIRDESFGMKPPSPKKPKIGKGIRSLFQLPARKRR